MQNEKPKAKLKLGNCLDILKTMPDNYVDSIVTDPPYGLSFMGKKWDYDVPSKEIWAECLRVLKPGGHLLAFGGTRTYHRLVVAIEDAGFEIRDQIQWIYGSGFPKSLDISKAIDKAAGTEREVIGTGTSGKSAGMQLLGPSGIKGGDYDITAPATPEAKKWSGWGTALKPANEPICLARKPLSESTVAKNVLTHGTGGLNIDGTRIEFANEQDKKLGQSSRPSKTSNSNHYVLNHGSLEGFDRSNRSHITGRFPANVLFDEDAAKVLDEQTGILKSGALSPANNVKVTSGWSGGSQANRVKNTFEPNSGGASRFFYVAKASKSDRGEGNVHPTVKPVKLMEYLIKLITPPNGIVLDPFMGSGTTGVAAANLSVRFVGCEMSDEYFEIAKKRIENA